MKLERNAIVALTAGATFVLLLLFHLFTSGFIFNIKDFFVSIYFAIWVGALAFVIFTFIIPYIQERKKRVKAAKPGTGPGVTPAPFKSPRSGMPVRERIVAYVAERRKEDGLPAPEPLRPSRTVAPPSSSSARAAAPAVSMPVAAAVQSVQAPAAATSSGDDMGDLPLPDDFGSVDSGSDDLGSLPGLDDDFGGMDEFGGSDDISSGLDGDNAGLLDGDEESVSAPVSDDLPSGGLSDDGLPAFDDDLDSGFGGSDMLDDAGMDLSGDDVLTMDDEDSPVMSDDRDSGGLSEAGLPDLDDSLEPDMMESDLGSDDDFGDIEFVDLEPDEPKSPPRK